MPRGKLPPSKPIVKPEGAVARWEREITEAREAREARRERESRDRHSANSLSLSQMYGESPASQLLQEISRGITDRQRVDVLTKLTVWCNQSTLNMLVGEMTLRPTSISSGVKILGCPLMVDASLSDLQVYILHTVDSATSMAQAEAQANATTRANFDQYCTRRGQNNPFGGVSHATR